MLSRKLVNALNFESRRFYSLNIFNNICVRFLLKKKQKKTFSTNQCRHLTQKTCKKIEKEWKKKKTKTRTENERIICIDILSKIKTYFFEKVSKKKKRQKSILAQTIWKRSTKCLLWLCAAICIQASIVSSNWSFSSCKSSMRVDLLLFLLEFLLLSSVVYRQSRHRDATDNDTFTLQFIFFFTYFLFYIFSIGKLVVIAYSTCTWKCFREQNE